VRVGNQSEESHNQSLVQFSVECQPIAKAVFVDRAVREKIVLSLLSGGQAKGMESKFALA
jgi:hypothetical protein